MAKKLLQSLTCVCMLTTEVDAIHTIMQFKLAISDKLGCAIGGVVNLVQLNWCSPCSILASHQTMHARLLSWAMSENGRSAGVLMMPVFCHRMGGSSGLQRRRRSTSSTRATSSRKLPLHSTSKTTEPMAATNARWSTQKCGTPYP